MALMKKTLFIAGACVLGLSVAFTLTFLLLEVVLRLLGDQPTYQQKVVTLKKRYDKGKIISHLNPYFQTRVAHPYFGYTHNPLGGSVNNYGLAGNVDYPYRKNNNKEIVIAVFGGSVAAALVFDGNPLEEKLNSTELLRDLHDCGFQFKVLNMALSGGKQPMQFNIASYFMESYDIAVNIDGVNEVFASTSDVFPADYPQYADQLYHLTNEKLSIIKRVFYSQYLRHRFLSFVYAHKYLLHLDSFSFAFARIDEILNQLPDEAYIKDNMGYQKGKVLSVAPSDRLDKLVHAWVINTKKQFALLKSFDKLTFYFLQPFIYVNGAKKISDKESKVAYDEINAAEFERKYMKLIIASNNFTESLKGQFWDFSRVFSSEVATLFVDECCHLNVRGQSILAHGIVERISPFIKLKWRCELDQTNNM